MQVFPVGVAKASFVKIYDLEVFETEVVSKTLWLVFVYFVYFMYLWLPCDH